MSKLNALNLIAYERPTANDPKRERRQKLLDKLAEQSKLAADSSYIPTTHTWITDTDGQRRRIEKPKRVKRWWGSDANGDTVLTIRYGSKPLELAKGKQAIKLASEADVAPTLQMIAEAVEAGELDAAIERQAAITKPLKKQQQA